jgi:hypothetical protein
MRPYLEKHHHKGGGRGKGGEMMQTLYAHMNKIKIKKKRKKKAIIKRAGRVAQGVGPEFKLQYRQKKKKRENN